mmetsp:Transcript_38511/g.83878  ORF Transcript_38511/g.83878 Transcript_38511/m.83878 type:complete len:215 (-) Transcript_38511:8-652(-)
MAMPCTSPSSHVSGPKSSNFAMSVFGPRLRGGRVKSPDRIVTKSFPSELSSTRTFRSEPAFFNFSHNSGVAKPSRISPTSRIAYLSAPTSTKKPDSLYRFMILPSRVCPTSSSATGLPFGDALAATRPHKRGVAAPALPPTKTLGPDLSTAATRNSHPIVTATAALAGPHRRHLRHICCATNSGRCWKYETDNINLGIPQSSPSGRVWGVYRAG